YFYSSSFCAVSSLLSRYRAHRCLPSFPTRRSSDLERAALPAKLRQQLPERTRAVDALELASFAIGDDGKGTESAIDAHRTCLRPARPALGMQGRGFYIQTHPPVSPLARTHRCKQDLRATLVQHPPQPTRALAHSHTA